MGAAPAFIALTLYALLPIVRNTHAGLSQIPRGMKQAAQSLGLAPGTILHRDRTPWRRRRYGRGSGHPPSSTWAPPPLPPSSVPVASARES
ncbi:MAG: hypothetical protein MZV49_20985 [Rhodopseudomonas palustris]|nr:hypothetical protein [Rhodopseudomonas palustris]